MILFYTVMGIALEPTSEHMCHPDHRIKGLGILMLHELQYKIKDYNPKLSNLCLRLQKLH